MYLDGNVAYFVHREIMPLNLRIKQTLLVDKLRNDKWWIFFAILMNK